MQGVDGICSKARPGRFTDKQQVDVNPGEGKTVTWPIVPMDVSMPISFIF